ncbi:MAG TPA: HAD-IIA family hydrolase [Jatrophihabitans sp.]
MTIPLGSDHPLDVLYDVALLDLDGVVYIGPNAVPGVPEALGRARHAGMQIAFVTNNAARPPAVVASHLTELGIVAESAEVITSAQAAARYLAEHLPAGAKVLVVGTTGLYEALTERGLVPVALASDDVMAVVQGYSPATDWHMLAEGAVAIGHGKPWVATNGDPTVPSPRGPLPGNGSLVAALRYATGREPVITGKPDPAMHRETILRTGASNPLVVGDRLDTDIEGANAVGCASLLVFSGVTRPKDVLFIPAHLRPTYFGSDLAALLHSHVGVTRDEDGWHCGTWHVFATETGLLLSHDGSAEDDGWDALRVLAVASWVSADREEEAERASGVIGAADSSSAAELSRLGLS